jgi:ketose-bisphosphate aldolase
MPLAQIQSLLNRCQEGRYAIGYFESWNLESLQGVIDAAEQTRSPIVIGFNGEFLCHAGRRAVERLAIYAAMGRAVAESSSVPCGLIFNECPNDQWVMDAADVGFNLVMLADPNATYDDYTRRVKRIVQHAHQRQAAVEAELGELPCGVSEHAESRDSLTDPDQAAAFARETGVDLLAVSAGNVHILLEGQRELDLAHLAAIRKKVDVPLVLHGGSGITASSLVEAIALGVVKVNYGTYLKQRCLAAVRRALVGTDVNPHHLLGFGGDADLMVAARQAVCDAVLERIELLGCCGRA